MPWTNDKIPESRYGVICPTDGKQGLSEDEYMRQLSRPDSKWKCPGCGGDAAFDEDRYEREVA
jgi:hypothetical protein